VFPVGPVAPVAPVLPVGPVGETIFPFPAQLGADPMFPFQDICVM
jgi:hypothetical protein